MQPVMHSGAMAEMPRYRSHKQVWALKIARVNGHTLSFEEKFEPITVDPTVLSRYTPVPGDYLVVYADGYQSISPAKAFEEGYTPDAADAQPQRPERLLNDHRVNPANDTIEIRVLDKPGAGGACHEYEIVLPNGKTTAINFQNGTIAVAGINGVTQEALLAIVADRLRAFQDGPYACSENMTALQSVDRALYWLHRRTKERVKRGVEGMHAV